MTTVATDPNGKGTRLDSWKSIADYLGLEVRSVQRWESERGLPIHRVPGEKRGRVFAFTAELDEWLSSRRQLTPASPQLSELSSAQSGASAGIKPPAVAHATPRFARYGILTSIVVLAALLAGAYAALHWSHPTVVAHNNRAMLAVLPFLNLSGDSSQDYFVDGLTEEMITDLGRLNPQALGVIARTSAMKYKGTHDDIAQIGRDLGVDYILEGSVRRSGDTVRISAQLIQVGDQTHLWAQNYERQFSDILSVQQDVAQNIADKIQIHLSNPQPAASAQSQPANAEAYDNYLQGLYCLNRRTDPGLTQSARYFKDALQEDPDFAPAYAGLAQADTLLAQASAPDSRVRYVAEGRQAAVKAIELDDASAEAHTALAGMKIFFDFDFPGAEKEFQRAIQLNPNYAAAHHWYANLYLDPMGRFSEAIAEMQTARRLDPANLIIYADYGQAYFFARQYAEAFEIYKKVLTMDPNFLPVHWYLANYYQQFGLHDAEVNEVVLDAAAEGTVYFSGGDPAGASPRDLRRAYRSGGYDGFLRERLVLMHQGGALSGFGGGPESVFCYALLGEKDQAIVAAEQGYAARNVNMIYIGVHPGYDSLRSDPRFQALEKKMGLLPH